MYEPHETGRKGEDVAVKYLKKQGYIIMQRNFRCKIGEIDIIAFDKNKKELVFFEVKTRKNTSYGTPAEAITVNKKKHIYKVAQYYLYSKKIEDELIRIDVIEVYLKGDLYKINHLKQALM